LKSDTRKLKSRASAILYTMGHQKGALAYF